MGVYLGLVITNLSLRKIEAARNLCSFNTEHVGRTVQPLFPEDAIRIHIKGLEGAEVCPLFTMKALQRMFTTVSWQKYTNGCFSTGLTSGRRFRCLP